MDYIVYGTLYPMIGLDVGFQEIDFTAIDDTIVCYNLNDYGSPGGGVPDRTTSGVIDKYGGLVTC